MSESYVILECENCGDEYERHRSQSNESRFCSLDCQNQTHFKDFDISGDAHPRWKGGHVNTESKYYGYNWESQREKALERDGHQCQACGISSEQAETPLHVHHITPIEEFDKAVEANKLENLRTLCLPCHRESHSENGTREAISETEENDGEG